MTGKPAPGAPNVLRLRVGPGEGATASMDLHWPGPDDRCTVHLRARRIEVDDDAEPVIEIAADVRFADATRPGNRRRLAVRETAASLFEAYRVGDRPLTFGIRAEIIDEPVIRTGVVAGRPVRLQLEIVRVLDGRTIPLETNQLHTFVGEPVGYSFSLGPPENSSVDIRLKPLRVTGEIIELEFQLSGTLPGKDVLVAGGRREEWIASRGAASTIAFESGEPPNGYRFIVTPQF